MSRERLVISESLLRIEPVPQLQLIAQMDQLDWINNRLMTSELVTQSTAALVAFDTETEDGQEFDECMQSIRDWHRSLEEKGIVECVPVNYPNVNRGALFITPPEDRETIDEAIGYWQAGTKQQAKLNNTLLHVHIDTFQTATEGELGGLRTFFNQKTGELFGRGTCDMKGIAGILPFIYRLCEQKGIKPPVVVITSDEEICGELGGLELLKSIKSNWLTIDLEPIAGHPGSYTNTILPGVMVELACDSSSLNIRTINELQRALEKQFTRNLCLPRVSLQGGLLGLYLSTQFLTDTPKSLAEQMIDIAATTSIVPSQSKHPIQIIPGYQSPLHPTKRGIVESSLIKNYKWNPTSTKPTHVSSSLSGVMGRFNRESVCYGLYSTLGMMAYGGEPDVIILGTDEAGGGRHTPEEAVIVNQLGSVLNSTLQIHAGLVKMYQNRKI